MTESQPSYNDLGVQRCLTPPTSFNTRRQDTHWINQQSKGNRLDHDDGTATSALVDIQVWAMVEACHTVMGEVGVIYEPRHIRLTKIMAQSG